MTPAMAGVAQCQTCGEGAAGTARTVDAHGERWSVAWCPRCRVEIPYRLGAVARVLELPGAVQRSVFDPIERRLVAAWVQGERRGASVLHATSGWAFPLALPAGTAWTPVEAGFGLVAGTAGPGDTALVYDTATGEAATPAQAARWAGLAGRARAADPPVFGPIGGHVEGSEAFASWAALVQQHTGRRPVMRLHAVHHDGFDVVDAIHLEGGDSGPPAEHVLVVRDGRVRWDGSIRPADGSVGAHLVGFGWNLAGIWIQGGFLIVHRTPTRIDVFPLG